MKYFNQYCSHSAKGSSCTSGLYLIFNDSMIFVIIQLTNISRQVAYQSIQMISFPVRLYTYYNTIKCVNKRPRDCL